MPLGEGICFSLLFPCSPCQSRHAPVSFSPLTSTQFNTLFWHRTAQIDQGRCLCQGHEHITSALSSLSGSGYLPSASVIHGPAVSLEFVTTSPPGLLADPGSCCWTRSAPLVQVLWGWESLSFSLPATIASGVICPWEAACSCCFWAGCWPVRNVGLWFCGLLGLFW